MPVLAREWNLTPGQIGTIISAGSMSEKSNEPRSPTGEPAHRDCENGRHEADDKHGPVRISDDPSALHQFADFRPKTLRGPRGAISALRVYLL
jgi:hypothetical protein